MSAEKDFQDEVKELNKDVEKFNTTASWANQLDITMRGVKRVFNHGFNVVPDATIQCVIIDALRKGIHLLNKELPNETTNQKVNKLGTATLISQYISLLTADMDMIMFMKALATMKSESSTISHLNSEQEFVDHFSNLIWKRHYTEHMEQMNQLKKENAELKGSLEKAHVDMANLQQQLNVLNNSIKNIIAGASATATTAAAPLGFC